MHGYIFKIETLGVDIAAGEKWKEGTEKEIKKKKRGKRKEKGAKRKGMCFIRQDNLKKNRKKIKGPHTITFVLPKQQNKYSK